MVVTTILTLLTSIAADVTNEKPLAGAVIVVDPGHGGQSYSRSYTGGTTGVSSKLTESELNLRVGTELTKRLKDAGATVHQIRTGDYRLSREGSSSQDELHARIDFFEHYNPHFFLSVHHNAAAEAATGHTAIYKHNASDDTLYEQLAASVNDALTGVLPGPKRKLIKGNFHITRETDIPGTISEAGFMTNKLFDQVCNQLDFAKTEAAAITKGVIVYWERHRESLNALREKLKKERDAKPRDPQTLTATALNPTYQKMMAERLTKIAPEGKYSPEKVGDYLSKFKAAYFPDSQATLEIAAEFDGKIIRLTGESSDRAFHDQFIDLLVAMKLYTIKNTVKLPVAAKEGKPIPPR
jgi:N-acetylmuramoyl-L-alanine amidase